MSLPGGIVQEAMVHVMPLIEKGESPYDKLALSVTLAETKLNLPGNVSVPIRTRVAVHPELWTCALDISAAGEVKFFPEFHGDLVVKPLGAGTCELWLQGTYEPPVGKAGNVLDVTLLRGVAKRSLQSFLEWLADDFEAYIAAHEKKRDDQARGRHGGG